MKAHGNKEEIMPKNYEDFCKKMQEAHRADLAGKIRDLL